MHRTRKSILARAGHLVSIEGDGTDVEGGGDTAQAGDSHGDDQPGGESAKPEQKPEFTPPASQEEFDRIIQKRIDRERAKFSDYDDLKQQIQAANDAAGRIPDLENAVTAAEKRAERAELAAEVATSKGVRLRYLTGDTREELEASADEVLEDFKSMSKIGVVPTQGTGEIAPRATGYAAGAQRSREKHERKDQAS